MRLTRLSDSVFFAGLVLGVGAAVVQAYFNLVPPTAYGVCMVCHPKELVNWVADHVLGTHWGYAIASIDAPILTVVGVALGATFAAWRHGELRLQSARQPVWYFVLGFLMINFGLVLSSCPIRIVLLSAYGSITGIAAWFLVIVGVGAGIMALRWNAERDLG